MENPGQLEIRTATLEDAPTFNLWDEKPHVKAATSNDGLSSFDADWQEELGPRSDGTVSLIAELTGKPIGAMQITNPATERTQYWGDMAPDIRAIDIWIGEEQYLGQGYGTVMMTHAIEYCFAEPEVAAILIDPLSNNLRAHQFYERLGFKFVERRVFDEDSDCFVYRLDREAWQRGGRL